MYSPWGYSMPSLFWCTEPSTPEPSCAATVDWSNPFNRLLPSPCNSHWHSTTTTPSETSSPPTPPFEPKQHSFEPLPFGGHVQEHSASKFDTIKQMIADQASSRRGASAQCQQHHMSTEDLSKTSYVFHPPAPSMTMPCNGTRKVLSMSMNNVFEFPRVQLPPSARQRYQQQQHMNGGGGCKRQMCSFCKSNGESINVYSSHNLRNYDTNEIECPVLMAYTCPKCGATGKQAHTVKYCTALSEHERVALPTVKQFKEGRNAAGSKSLFFRK